MWLSCEQIHKVHGVVLECMQGQKLSYRSGNVVYTPSGVHLEVVLECISIGE